MADIILTQAQSLPATTRIRYKDMGDGTHAEVVVTDASGSGGFTLLTTQSVPPTVRTRWLDQGDGTHARRWARG